MILTATDTIQTTKGPLWPLTLPDKELYLYGFDGQDLIPVEQELTGNTGVHSAIMIEVSAKRSDGKPQYAIIPWDYWVLLANGDELPAHELTTGTKLAYFTRVMRHEKYAAMRVIPQMKSRVLEHRWVWEVHAGMEVPATHNVDHIDGDSYNNAYNNLRALEIKAHSKMTALRQTNRHTGRNADGSFAKGSTTTRIASADKPIPDFLDTGTVGNFCRVVAMEEVTLEKYFFTYRIPDNEDMFIIMGNLVVRPTF